MRLARAIACSQVLGACGGPHAVIRPTPLCPAQRYDAATTEQERSAVGASATEWYARAGEARAAGEHPLALERYLCVWRMLDGHPRRELVLYDIAASYEAVGQLSTALGVYQYLQSVSSDIDVHEQIWRLRARLRAMTGNQTQ